MRTEVFSIQYSVFSGLHPRTTHHASRTTFHASRFMHHLSRSTLPMTWLNNLFIFLAAFLAVFWEAAFNPVRHLLGAQVDLLPPIMVYASLTTGLGVVSLLALCGGL